MFNSIPVTYQEKNIYNSAYSPSTIHSRNNNLTNFFARYLIQKVMSVYKWELPETWASNYFLYVLYLWGYISVFNTDRFGVICQGCGLYGYNVFYQPTHAIIANPLIDKTLEPRIGVECEIIRLQPDYGGMLDLVTYYADLMSVASEAVGFNFLNSRMSYVFSANNKAGAESLKKLYDEVTSGSPAVFIDNKLRNADGTAAWELFSQNVGQNYIADRVISDMRKIEAEFDTIIGIPNANTDKRERLITDEVNANNVETQTRAEMWLEEMQNSVAKVNSMFGLNISVDWRNKPAQLMTPNPSVRETEGI